MSCDIFLKSTVPTKDGALKVEGLKQSVSIYRDDLGIPLIQAKNEDDAFFAAGYTHASDRLWQMTALKMLSQGRLTEVFGDAVFSVDLYMRTMSIRNYAGKIIKKTPQEILEKYDHFARGVNSFVRHNSLPPEFHLLFYRPEKWEVIDSICVYLALNLMLSVNHIEELSFLRFSSEFGLEKTVHLFPNYINEPIPQYEINKLKNVNFHELTSLNKNIFKTIENLIKPGLPASNNWVSSPRKNIGSKALLANDTHLEHTIPSAWIILGLKSPSYQVIGATLPGVPVISAGYNGKIAWGVTMLMGDSQDIFLEKLKNINGKTHYLFKNKWLPVQERKETFKIRGGKEVIKTIQSTHHGPLMNEILKEKRVGKFQPHKMKSEYGLAHRWSAADGDRATIGFYLLGKAGSMKEARSAISLIDGIYLNMLYSDGENIAWVPTGKIPLRARGDGKLPSPGWNGLYEWEGYLPFEKKPMQVNPREGFLATANNRVVGRGYPYRISSSWYGPERLERAVELLKSKKNKIDLEYMVKMQFDRKSLLHTKVKKVLFDTIDEDVLYSLPEGTPKNDALYAWDQITGFHGDLQPHSRGAAVYSAFIYSFARNVFYDELGKAWDIFLDFNRRSYDTVQDHLISKKNSIFFDDINTPQKKENKADILISSLADAVKFCRGELGKNKTNWNWGRLHLYHWRHFFSKELPFFSAYLDRGPYPAGGSRHTLNVGGFLWGGNFETYIIPATRMIVDFSKKEPLFLISHAGQSGNPSSPHYSDMIPYFLSGRAHPVSFNSPPIKGYKYKLTLQLK